MRIRVISARTGLAATSVACPQASGRVEFVRRSERSHVPEADSCTAANTPSSFDNLVGTDAHCWWHVKPERLRGPEVDYQLIFGRRLHRQIGRLLALEDAIDVARCEPPLVHRNRPIGDQAAVVTYRRPL